MARKIQAVQLARRISLGIILAFITVMTILHQRLQNIPSIDALCPFGGVETIYKLLAGGELIKKIMPANIVLLIAIVVLGVVLSRFFCGWLCAFGALQGIFGWLGKKIFGRHFTVPEKLDRVLRWIKYPILAAILYFTWQTGTLIIRPYDPWAAYGHLSAGIGAVWAEFSIGFVILVVSLVLSMVYERAFCKYVCPLGAFNAILGRIPLFRIKRESKTCISCSKCDKVCPMNIDVSHPEAVSSAECISCMECVTVCPTKRNTLYTTIMGKVVKVGVVAIIGIGIYYGALGVGQAFGKLDFLGPSLAKLAEEGNLKVEDIKGSTTWQMVADSFGIELERLFREAGVDAKKVPGDTKLKDTGSLLGIEFEADLARIAVAKIIGVPYSGENGDAKPEESAPILDSNANPPAESPAIPAKPNSEAVAPASPGTTIAPAKTVVKPAAALPSPPEASSTGTAFVVPADFALEGTMTIKEIAAALKATEAAVIAKLELPANIPADKPLRDMKDQYGYTMTNLKDRIKK